MIRRGTTTGEIEIYNDKQDVYYIIEVEISYVDEDGIWYDNDGSGYPASCDWDYKILSCTDEEGNNGCNDDWIKYEMIEGELLELLSIAL